MLKWYRSLFCDHDYEKVSDYYRDGRVTLNYAMIYCKKCEKVKDVRSFEWDAIKNIQDIKRSDNK